MEDIVVSLKARREVLQGELERLTEPPVEGVNIGFGKRVGEGTSEAVERLATTATARSLFGSIADIDTALAKIEAETYGFCESCERPISEARLEARPASTLCFSCATAR